MLEPSKEFLVKMIYYLMLAIFMQIMASDGILYKSRNGMIEDERNIQTYENEYSDCINDLFQNPYSPYGDRRKQCIDYNSQQQWLIRNFRIPFTLDSNVFCNNNPTSYVSCLCASNIGLANIDSDFFEATHQLKYLEISKNDLKNLYITSDTLLIINGTFNQITDVDLNTNNLLVLNLSDNRISNCNFLQKLPNLVKLILKNNNLTSIEDLSQNYGLEILDVSFNNLKNVDFINKMPNLKFFFASHNNITHVHLTNLDLNLIELDLSHNNILVFSFKPSFFGIERLILNNNNLSKIDGQFNNVQLNILDISNNNFEQIDFLNYQPQLDKLLMSGNKISKIQNLVAPNLKFTDLSFNQLTDLNFTESLSNLQTLLINNNKIENVLNLALDLLNYLDISNNHLKEINLNCSKLNNTIFNNNTISSIGYFRTNLTDLNLSNQKLVSINFLTTLGKVENLSLSNNQISNFPFGIKNEQLKFLDLSRNQITSLKAGIFSQMKNLVHLDVSNNQINYLDDLIPLHSLRVLKFHGNQMEAFEYLSLFSDTDLQTITFFNNPLKCTNLREFTRFLRKKRIEIQNGNCYTRENYYGICCN